MPQFRPDMSDWVLHFTHDRNLDNEFPVDDESWESIDREFPAVVHVDPEINAKVEQYYEFRGDRERLSDEAGAFEVLMRIITQGLIKSTWSFRGGKSTIYGPKAAVCFTEMPLSSLVEYARDRAKGNLVGCHAIGFLKSELYEAGGRPVIYGLSSQHHEVHPGAAWPRYLHSSCGIGDMEQYRYVAFRLGGSRTIDWTHEREWRWADHTGNLEVPGLPVWQEGPNFYFTKAIIVVQSKEEATEVLIRLQRSIDAKSDGYSSLYNIALLGRTAVVALDELVEGELLKPGVALKLEDIPRQYVRPVPVNPISDQAKAHARMVIAEVLQAANAAAAKWAKGGDRGICGFAELVIDDGLAEFTRAALELDLLEPVTSLDSFSHGGYWVKGVTDGCTTQGLGEHEAAVEAGMAVLERHFPDLPTHAWTRWD